MPLALVPVAKNAAPLGLPMARRVVNATNNGYRCSSAMQLHYGLRTSPLRPQDLVLVVNHSCSSSSSGNARFRPRGDQDRFKSIMRPPTMKPLGYRNDVCGWYGWLTIVRVLAHISDDGMHGLPQIPPLVLLFSSSSYESVHGSAVWDPITANSLRYVSLSNTSISEVVLHRLSHLLFLRILRRMQFFSVDVSRFLCTVCTFPALFQSVR